MRKTVLVTGAGGYIGRHVVDALLKHDVNVSVVDLKFDGIDERAKRLNVNIFSGDADIYEQLGKPDVVLHMAWGTVSSTILRRMWTIWLPTTTSSHIFLKVGCLRLQ